MFDRDSIIQSINYELEKCSLVYLIALNETLKQHTKGIDKYERTQGTDN